MTLALVILVGLLVAGVPVEREHIATGLAAGVGYEVRVNGQEIPASPLGSSPVGIVRFEVVTEGPSTASLRVSAGPRPGVTCRETER